ncbi:MAG: hypothetical protein JRF50_15430 [Deltaproteobacteria bacterium]|nr:hypothetical protein [Deltaproteobacteria bacterium]
MKCPKCSYISFDYNQRCPKCNKDLVSEQKKRNLAAFKHNPPFLLATLTGDVDSADSASEAGIASDAGSFEEDDLEMHLDTEVPSTTEADVEDVSLDLGDLSLTENVPETPAASRGAAPDESEMVTKEIGKKKPGVSEDSEDIDLELDLEDLE